MADGEGLADIAVKTGYLRQFASQDFGPQLDGLAAAAATAHSKAGEMVESQDLFRAESVARDQLVSFMTKVKQGMLGYRVATADLAALYDETEGRVVQNMQKVMPFETNLPEQDPRFAEAVTKGE